MADKKAPNTLKMLIDPNVPPDLRRKLMAHVFMDESPQAAEMQNTIFTRLTEASGQELFTQKTADLDKLINDLKSGPLRRATYLRYWSSIRRAEVVLDDGNQPYVVVPDESLLPKLECGSTVFVDANCQAVVYADGGKVETGEVATFNSRIEGTDTLRIEFRDETTAVMRVTADLGRQIEKGEVAPGRRLLVCSRRMMAFKALPEDNSLSHYRYLERQAPPDVRVDRDVGSPPQFIRAIDQHVRIQMLRPDLAARWRLPMCRFFLLEGVSGTGKTLSVQAVWNMMYETISEITGIPVSELPFCVVRLSNAKFLSKWFGESDQNADRFFEEILQLADRVVIGRDGKPYHLPILAVLEECDGIARARGEDSIYDRVMTTILQRLDKARPELRSRLLIFVGTTNVVGQVDAAFVRRIGGRMERFGHLTRRGFTQVLAKRLRELPLACGNGDDPEQTRKRIVSDMAAWLFSPNGSDPGQVEITLAGSAEKIVKHRRDFLTGALIDRAVEEACGDACIREFDEGQQALDSETLMLSLDTQVRMVANQITPHNITQYLVVPDSVRVAAVRRMEQPAVLPMELLRAS
ncbi:MAG: ATP-binding protein [Planctomycetota bacterium]|nr:ATP-binding protein [Planctomycetota bacterium]